jgi:type II secretory pathway component PulC
MNASAKKSLIAKRKELLIAKTKLDGVSNYRKEIFDLRDIIDITKNNSKMPSIGDKLNFKMKAIMTAAEKASVYILSLKPNSSVIEDEDGSTKILKDKYLSIEGNANINTFLNFLKNLWGVELEEIELSSAAKDGSKLRFYIKVSFLEKIKSAMQSSKEEKSIDINFGVKNNVFAKITPPLPPEPLRFKSLTPPKPVHHLDGAKLIGIAEFGNTKIAIIEDGITKETNFYSIGSKFKESKLYKVDSTSAVFMFSDGGNVTLKLPVEKLYYDIDSNDDNMKKKGRLGILAKTFTDQLANQNGTPFKPGLLVVSSGSHGDVLQKGDLITSINGTYTPDFEAALNIMKNVYIGEDLKIEILRRGESKKISYKAD